MWKEEWDEPYLNLLDRVTLRQFKGMKVFDINLWHRFAQVLKKEVGSKDFDGTDCLNRGVSLRREYRKMVLFIICCTQILNTLVFVLGTQSLLNLFVLGRTNQNEIQLHASRSFSIFSECPPVSQKGRVS